MGLPGGRSSAGRAPGCGPGGRGFESRRSPSATVLQTSRFGRTPDGRCGQPNGALMVHLRPGRPSPTGSPSPEAPPRPSACAARHALAPCAGRPPPAAAPPWTERSSNAPVSAISLSTSAFASTRRRSLVRAQYRPLGKALQIGLSRRGREHHGAGLTVQLRSKSSRRRSKTSPQRGFVTASSGVLAIAAVPIRRGPHERGGGVLRVRRAGLGVHAGDLGVHRGRSRLRRRRWPARPASSRSSSSASS
jgi:hypothetical protein